MISRSRLLFCLFFLALWPGAVWTQTAPPQDFSIPAGMVRRDFPLGAADLTTVEELCRETLTGGGKFHVFPTTRKLLVIGRPEEVEAIRQTLPHLSQPAPNVKIEFIGRTMSDDSRQGLQVTGQARGRAGQVIIGGGPGGTPGVIRRSYGGGDPGDLSRPVPPNSLGVRSARGGAIDINLLGQTSGGSSLSSHFILVQSGREGFIEVAREVPMIDYFTRYVASGSYGAVLGIVPYVARNPNLLILAGGQFEAPQIRWEKAGTRLLVHPVVEGNLVHLTVMPQISAIKIVDWEVFRARGLNTYLTGREQYVTYTNLATTVTLQSGSEAAIGGFAEATPEFSRFFFGGTAQSSSSLGTFTVRATIQ